MCTATAPRVAERRVTATSTREEGTEMATISKYEARQIEEASLVQRFV